MDLQPPQEYLVLRAVRAGLLVITLCTIFRLL